MSEKRQEIKAAFDVIRELSGQSGKYAELDNGIDLIIDKLNDFAESVTDPEEIEKAKSAIERLLRIKDDDVASVKVYEMESRGKKATRSKVRDYERQLDSAIGAVRSELSDYL